MVTAIRIYTWSVAERRMDPSKIASTSTRVMMDSPMPKKRCLVLSEVEARLPRVISIETAIWICSWDHASYPERIQWHPRVKLLLNDAGRFSDGIETVAPELMSAGMVTSALWTDANGDGWTDLLVAYEWGTGPVVS